MNAACSSNMGARRLGEASEELERVLARSMIRALPLYSVSQIRCETTMVAMPDGVRLATDVYLPPVAPAPAIAIRTPYGRGADALVGAFLSFARRGYVVVSQDCRGTGDSEPGQWDFYVYEPEDSHHFVDWVSRQSWFDGFLAGCGSSYLGSTQWLMALHPRMSTIVPEVAGVGLNGSALRSHMFVNAYARTVGKGEDKVPMTYVDLERRMHDETLARGYFNEPLYRQLPNALRARVPGLEELSPSAARQRLWEHYCSLTCAQRVELIKDAFEVRTISILQADSWGSIFGHRISPYAPTLPHTRLLQALKLPILLNTGWYDWGLDDTLATWDLIRREAPDSGSGRCCLFIAPSAHNMPGYHEGMAEHPELHHAHRTTTSVELLLRWYSAVREGKVKAWPRVIFYLMGANEWYCADDWPVPGAKATELYLDADGRLGSDVPGDVRPDRYTYDPDAPTPTVGGSIVSYVYSPGSVDVSEVQRRADVLVYTSEPLTEDLDVAGPLRLVVYASSTAVDTDFVARLSDVFPDGRAIQLQNGITRTRYRNAAGEPELLEPGEVYRLEIDMWATANRFKAGHRLRVDISSSDFPRFERHSNRAGESLPPIAAVQTIYHDRQHPSHLLLPVLRGRVP
jgi:predicted acyl esterase